IESASSLPTPVCCKNASVARDVSKILNIRIVPDEARRLILSGLVDAAKLPARFRFEKFRRGKEARKWRLRASNGSFGNFLN
ncbi:MAG TPA: hypothetical protein PLV92_24085, partial [Pirellulaceae bacterium]|nr:hypothetical protein [Pirellulaceae bacterium]